MNAPSCAGRTLAFASLVLLVSRVSFAQSARPEVEPEPTVISDQRIEALLAPILEKHKVPGLVAGIVKDDALIAAGAVGDRKAGTGPALRVNDKLHLGSCTKAMTATCIAGLVEKSKLNWQSTIGTVFSRLAADLHADFVDVTLEQLLTHRAGLPANGPWGQLGNGSVVEQRETLLKKILSQAPVDRPGTKFLYSNVGYVVAGHMAEEVTGQSWEDLMTAGLFTPLKMTSAGFGVPGTKGETDQPWGHQLTFGKVVSIQNDNVPALGPAGTVHCSLPDWARFIAVHLRGARGEGGLLKPETLRFLQTPPEGADYACGWIVVERPWAKGKALTHSGSNTYWFATVWIAPERDFALLVVANQGGPAGQQACDAAILALIENYESLTLPVAP
ncbi:MAG: class A beta-lactamase-related serine hydrolase [Planctomycetaceae bacterium]|nr:class A beta-lactamase-related serine hydrolase [Planctomycetaceae bacterium]